MIKIESLKGVKIDEVEGLEIESYIPISLKIRVADRLSEMLIQENSIGVYECNPADVMVMKAVSLVALYTNIELLENDYDNYDILFSDGKIDYIKGFIGDDVNSFYEVIEMTLNNKLAERNSLNHVLALKLTDVVDIVDKTMGHVNDMLDKGDPNKIAKYLSKGIEMIAVKLPDFSNADVFNMLKDFKHNGIK